MADYTFFFNPMSRAQIARWALHEAEADYDAIMVPWEDKPEALIKANPMAKVPTIIHHRVGGDHIVSEAAAICHYLAEAEMPDLLPKDDEKADYFRWLFFAAGPLEQAITAKSLGWTVSAKEQVMAGFGSYERTIDALEDWFASHDYVCGGRFTMADVYVGSAIDWGLQFKSLPERAAFTAYQSRIADRAAYKAAKAIDNKLIEEMQA